MNARARTVAASGLIFMPSGSWVEGVVWIVRTGPPCRNLPEAFGNWNSVLRRWSAKVVWWRFFEARSGELAQGGAIPANASARGCLVRAFP